MPASTPYRRRHRRRHGVQPRRPADLYRLEQSQPRHSAGKDVITLRLDRDLLDWLRAQGKATRPV